MATISEKKGVLCVFESDGYDWAKYIAELLRCPPYNLPCREEHWWNLNSDIATAHQVHVLMFSPLMQAQIGNEKFSCLRNESENSLLLEFNVDTRTIQMPAWKNTRVVDTSMETQKGILSTIHKMCISEKNDDYDVVFEDFVIIDIIPDCLYPGEKRIFILFNEKPRGKVTVGLEGMSRKLPTLEYTKNSYICDLPEIGAGVILASVYEEGNHVSLFEKKIIIATSDFLLENLIENLQETLQPIKRRDSIQSVFGQMGFDPFSEKLCTSQNKRYYAKRITELSTKYDSGVILEDDHYEELSDQAESRPPPVFIRNQGLHRFHKDSGYLTNHGDGIGGPPEKTQSENLGTVFKKGIKNFLKKTEHRKTTVPELPTRRRILED